MRYHSRFILLCALASVCAAAGTTHPLFATLSYNLQTSYQPVSGFPRDDPKGSIVFSSPSVVDLDGDGRNEVLIVDGDGCVYAFAANGTPRSGFPLRTAASCKGVPRSTTHVAVGDLDGDGRPELVVGTEGSGSAAGQRGKVFAWHSDGSLVTGWPQEMDFNTAHASATPEVYSVALADVDGDGHLDVLAGTNNNASLGGTDDVDKAFNLYVWHANGTLLPGYPSESRTAGIYGELAAADLTGDGRAEVITGRDHPYLHITDATATPLPNWPLRLFVDPAATDPRKSDYIGLTHAAPAAADLDGDGTVEVVVAGKVQAAGAGTVIGNALLVLEPDGTRRAGWEHPPLGGARLTSTDEPHQAPALGDLDGDGVLDIVVSTFDGHIRAYRADGTRRWDYDYAAGKQLFASEPALGDIDGDGRVDVVFGTYSPQGNDTDAVRLIGLHGDGTLVSGFPLVLTEEASHSNQGVRAAPTLADLDGDGHTDILASSLGGVVYAWSTPAQWNAATAPWPTGRHDLRRSASISTADSKTGTIDPSTLPYKIYLAFVRKVAR